MKTNNQLSEMELAQREVVEAKRELERVTILFNLADDLHFEIANQELTIAKMKYDNCWKKFQLLFAIKN